MVIWHQTYYDKGPLSERNCCRHMGYSFLLAARIILYAPYDHSVRKETHCHMGYSFQLAARVILSAPSHRQDVVFQILTQSKMYLIHNDILNDKTYLFVSYPNGFRCPRQAVTTEKSGMCLKGTFVFISAVLEIPREGGGGNKWVF